MRGQNVRWEATHTFNPAAVVRNGKINLLYRAEDDRGHGIGGFTSRLGLAFSSDGVHFRQESEPVLFPESDGQKAREWYGGCEDPRCVELPSGGYAVFYTQYSRDNGPSHTDLGLALSSDLRHWKKCGPVQAKTQDGRVIVPSKSASLVTQLVRNRLVAAKINGRYWLYYGEGTIHLMSSANLLLWRDEPALSLPPQPHCFDSDLAECGPPAVLTSRGILLFYNGKNAGRDAGDPSLASGTYSGGQMLFDPNQPTRLLFRSKKPFFQPELPWEKTGQYEAGTTFLEGLVRFHRRWFLYYGAADTFVGVASTR